MSEEPLSTQQIILLSVSCGILVLYHVIFVFIVYFFPSKVALLWFIRARRQWINTMMIFPGYEQTAFQSIRNAITSSTWFATTCILLSFAALQLGSTLNPTSTTRFTADRVSYYLTGAAFLLAFINFVVTIRNFLHLDFIVNAKEVHEEVQKQIDWQLRNANVLKKKDEEVEVCKVKLPKEIDETRFRLIPSAHKLITRATVHFNIGVRIMFVALVLSLWLFSSWVLFGGAVFMTFIFIYSDFVRTA